MFYFSHSILLLLSQGPEVPFPGNVFITHNHLDHAGELPMLFVIESKRRYKAGQPKLRLLCGPEVTERLKIHRLHEMLSLFKPVLYSALCAVLCRAVPCRAVPCRALLCRAVPCRAVPCLALPCFAVPCRALLCRAVPCLALPCVAVPCRAVPCFPTLYYSALGIKSREEF